MRGAILWTLAWEAVWLACVFGIDTNMYVGTGPDRWMKDRTPVIFNALGATLVATAMLGLGRMVVARWFGPTRRIHPQVLVGVLLAVAVVNGSIVASSTDANHYAYTRSGPVETQRLADSDQFVRQMLAGGVAAVVSLFAPVFVLWKTSSRARVEPIE